MHISLDAARITWKNLTTVLLFSKTLPGSLILIQVAWSSKKLIWKDIYYFLRSKTEYNLDLNICGESLDVLSEQRNILSCFYIVYFGCVNGNYHSFDIKTEEIIFAVGTK